MGQEAAGADGNDAIAAFTFLIGERKWRFGPV